VLDDEPLRLTDPFAVTGTEPPPPAEAGPSAEEVAAARHRRQVRNLVEWVVVIAGALLVSFGVKTWLLQSFYIPSASMVPTLEIDDRVIVNKLNDEIGDLGRGDIVVFERPPAMGEQGIEDLIKRVIAFPGETVEGRDGQVWIDGAPLPEPWLPEGVVTGDFAPEVVPAGTIWVMGDNRGASHYSRYDDVGPIPEDLIVGEAFVRIWPLDRLGGL
jgi:signal peptidase I